MTVPGPLETLDGVAVDVEHDGNGTDLGIDLDEMAGAPQLLLLRHPSDRTDAAKTAERSLAVHAVKPLPERDRIGGVVGLLLLPLLIGGLLLPGTRHGRLR